jgi:hypothetical protein
MANKGGKVLMQLRLSQEEARDLRAAAAAQSRTLPAEVMQRLRASLAGAEHEIDRELYGWSTEALSRNRALGQAVGYLAARLERVAGLSDDQQRDRATVLAMLKLALPVLLDRLGAQDNYLTPNHQAVAQAFAEGLAIDMAKAVEPPSSAAHLLPEAAALARIARGLDVQIHEWAKKFWKPKVARRSKRHDNKEA